MNTHDALLAAIQANPQDDTPRLVFADWLDENAGTVQCMTCGGYGYVRGGLRCGQCDSNRCVSDGRAERAEFIRVQCELAKPLLILIQTLLDETVPGETHRAKLQTRKEYLQRRERELWEKCWWEFGRSALPRGYVGGWNQTVPYGVIIRWRGVDLTRCLFRRGFIESVTCTAADWVSHGAAVLTCQPVERLTLTAWTVPSFRDVPIPLVPAPDSSPPWELEVRQGRLYSVDEHGAVEVEVMTDAVYRARSSRKEEVLP